MYGNKTKRIAETETRRLGQVVFVSLICLFAIWIGTGCQMSRIRSFDLDMGGLEMEFYEPNEFTEGTISLITNTMPIMPVSYPKLMPLERSSR